MNSKYGYSLTALQCNISSLQHITDFMSNNYLNVSYTIREKKNLTLHTSRIPSISSDESNLI